MKSTILTSTGTLIVVFALGCFSSNLYAQTNQEQSPAETEQAATETPRETNQSRPRVNFVKMANFYLRDGGLVFGELLSEDKNKITVKQLDESRIIVSTYSKREIDTRSLHIKNTPEYKYYIELAEYFAGRTWDFRDDPDDFIQAIRCYEQAKQSITDTQRQKDDIEQIDKRIEQLQSDKKNWIRQVESRANLKKLEFEAELEKRITELEDKADETTRQLDESIAEIKENYQKLEAGISQLNKELSRQDEQIKANRKLIDRIYYRNRWHWPQFYHYPYKKQDESPEKDQPGGKQPKKR